MTAHAGSDASPLWSADRPEATALRAPLVPDALPGEREVSAPGDAMLCRSTGTATATVHRMTDSESPKVRTRGHRLLRAAAATVLAGHGLIHLLGVALLWRWGQPGELRYDDVSPAAGSLPGMIVGGVWLAATLLFLLTAVLVLMGRPTWRPVGLLAALVSIAVLLPSASVALAGLVVDAAVLIAIGAAVAAAHRRPGRLNAGTPR